MNSVTARTGRATAAAGLVGGAATGAAVGGPVGAAVGAVVGGVAGALADPPKEVTTYVERQNVPAARYSGQIVVGQPFRLPPRQPGEKVDLAAATDRIMREIAALLPPEYRGV